MDQLLEKSNIDYYKLKKVIANITATELSRLVEPCYYPSLKKNYYELLHICNLSEKDIKEFTKNLYKNTPASKWKLPNDPITNFLIFIMYYFLKKKDQISFMYTMTYFCIRYYTNLMIKHIKYCNPDVFRYTLQNMSKINLFIREGTIPNGLYYLSNEMTKKYKKDILDKNTDKILKFITECRHRISQSVKSFSESYYKAKKDGSYIKTQEEEINNDDDSFQIQHQERSSKVIEQLVKNITIYKVIDQKALKEAKTITKININLANVITDKLCNIKYSDNIRNILQLFVKDLKEVKQLCGKDFYKIMKSLMSIKRTIPGKNYFKTQVNLLLQKILEEVNYIKEYEKLANQTKFLINSYLAYYITLSFRNHVC